ncbi:MAG: hypothetical protein ACK4K2_02065 [Dehalococcoidia bacterium]
MTLEARTVEERLARMEALQEATRDSVQELARRVDRLEGRIGSYFRWLMGTLLVMWVTIIATVVGTPLAALFTR